PALVVAQLQIEIALALAPDDRHGLLLRDAALAMTGRAQLRLLRDRLGTRDSRKHDGAEKCGSSEQKAPSRSRVYDHPATIAMPSLKKRRDHMAPSSRTSATDRRSRRPITPP